MKKQFIKNKNRVINTSVIFVMMAMFTGCNNSSDSIPYNEIHYTSSDGNIVEYCTMDDPNIKVVSNTYENGKGIIKFKDDLKEIAGAAFGAYADTNKRLVSVDIPESVVSIRSGAFMSCTNLSSVTIPNGVKEIWNDAFSGCTGLTSITIPNSVKKLKGWSTFSNCTNLVSIHLSDSITEIPDFTFTDCTSLSSIEIPDGVTKIGQGAFRGCSSLSSVVISNSVTEIDTESFQDCSSLTSIIIPNGVIKIGRNVFNRCKSLESVTIGNNVKEIGAGAFFNCEKFTEMHFLCTTPPQVDWFLFPTDFKKPTLYVPHGCKEVYSKHWYWKDFLRIIEE